MLPPEHRLRRSAEFTDVVRRGRRASRPTLTVHLLAGGPGRAEGAVSEPCRAGLVVSKAVGNSVVRHRTTRRLRHLLLAPVAALPAGSRLVVRAAPRAGTADSAVLGADLTAALAAALAKDQRAQDQRAQDQRAQYQRPTSPA